jgi:hypothetical protein
MASVAHLLTRRLTRGLSKRLDTTFPGGSGALTLIGAELNGVAIDFTDGTVIVRDTVTPANAFVGTVNSWLTYTSPSAKWIREQSGLYASGSTIRTEYSAAGVALGSRFEPARTNICLHSNDLTQAAWTASNMTTAKTATGADGAANSATTITATAGNATILQSITSASAARVTQCAIKRRTGSGTVQMTQNGGTLWTAVTVTSAWTIVTIPSATVTNPQVGLRIVTSGDAVDVMFFDCQTGSVHLSPIVTAGASVTRAADDITKAGGTFGVGTTISTFLEFAPLEVFGTIYAVGTLFSGGISGMQYSAGFHHNGAASVFSPSVGTPAAGVVSKVAKRFKNTDFAADSSDVALITQASAAYASPTGPLRLATNTFVGTQCAYHARKFLLLPRGASNAELTAFTG